MGHLSKSSGANIIKLTCEIFGLSSDTCRKTKADEIVENEYACYALRYEAWQEAATNAFAEGKSRQDAAEEGRAAAEIVQYHPKKRGRKSEV